MQELNHHAVVMLGLNSFAGSFLAAAGVKCGVHGE